MSPSPSFLVTYAIDETCFARLLRNDRYVVDMYEYAQIMPRQELLKRVAGKSAILCTSSDQIDAELLDAAGEQLRTVSTISAGYDHIDVVECERRGVTVGNTPDVLTDAVAELTIALMLATLRRLFEANQALREQRWPTGWGAFFMCGGMVKRSTVGFVGAGRIGRRIMHIINGFQPAAILYHTRSRNTTIEDGSGADHLRAQYVPSLNELLQRSDIVIVCCALNDSTKHLIGSEQLKMMRSDAILINTSRGAVIDQLALYEALKEKQIAAAGLDVYEKEPMPEDDPLLTLDNVVLLPHIGSATYSTRKSMVRLAVDNLEAGLDGRPLLASVV